MTDLSSRIRRALLSDPDEAVGSRLSADTIAAAVERIVMTVRSPGPAPLTADLRSSDPKGASPSGRGQPSPEHAAFAPGWLARDVDRATNRVAELAQPKPSPERNLTQGLIFDLETEAIEAVPYTRDLLLKAARALRARSLDPADKDAQ